MIKLKKNITFNNKTMWKNIILQEDNIPHHPYGWI